MTTCTFAGHREITDMGIANKVEELLTDILKTDTEFVFYTGGMGEFDDLCSGIVRKAKKRCKDISIKLILVLPYFKESLNKNKHYYEESFDEIVLPEEIAAMHYKSAIGRRNEWIVNQSQIVIAYIKKNYGGAFNTVKYAKVQKNKTIINL